MYLIPSGAYCWAADELAAVVQFWGGQVSGKRGSQGRYESMPLLYLHGGILWLPLLREAWVSHQMT